MAGTQEFITTRIRMLLAQRNESQAWLAEQLGWRPMRLSERMRGMKPFDTDELDQIAEAFGLSTHDLLSAEFPQAVA